MESEERLLRAECDESKRVIIPDQIEPKIIGDTNYDDSPDSVLIGGSPADRRSIPNDLSQGLFEETTSESDTYDSDSLEDWIVVPV